MKDEMFCLAMQITEMYIRPAGSLGRRREVGLDSKLAFKTRA